ncbi:unnamed protein product [Strongylus vulgaris]|uniref:Uncharacterized protein n=1 Tax=Strongylus vulgaris TaxID=40348 RepID=A0A3P7IB52_STRVU|nr:unnamed protein product [Strongylus vulgaris]
MRSKSVSQLRSLLSQWTCINHIHCYGIEEAGVLGAIEQTLTELKAKDESCLYVIVNCLLANGSVRILIEELLRELNLKRHGKVETIEALANFLAAHLFSSKKKVRLTIVLDQAQALSSIPLLTLKCLLSLPKSMPLTCQLSQKPLLRFVTCSELSWNWIHLLNTISWPVSIAFESPTEGNFFSLKLNAKSMFTNVILK